MRIPSKTELQSRFCSYNTFLASCEVTLFFSEVTLKKGNHLIYKVHRIQEENSPNVKDMHT